MTFEDLINNCAKTPEDLKGYGFPKNVTDAFLLTADEVHSVVMSRVPGKAVTTLIDEGYDLKSMYIKAKSCDWGPMAGFVCELPPFNKKGADGIVFNTRKTDEYKSNLNSIDLTDATVPDKQNPFIHIKISDKKKEEIIAGSYNIEFDGEATKSEIKGYARDKAENPTVLMQFLMKKEGDLWALYHGKIYTKNGSGDFKQYSKIRADENKNKFPWREVRYNNVVFANHSSIYPIRGLINPYPPYNGNEQYKNAVAGDYDLFAVWPYKKEDILISTHLVRVTEIMVEPFALSSVNAYFGYFKNKRLSVFTANNPNIIIEFIPEEAEEQELKNKKFDSEEEMTQLKIFKDSGNINNIIYTTAQMLNFFVQSIRGNNIPNRVFHSDEGGRQDVTEIEYPFAVFLPLEFHGIGQRLLKEGEFSGILLIESHEQFVTLINMLKDSYYVLLNHGWLIHFQANDIDKFKDGLKKILFGDGGGMDDALETIRKRLGEVNPNNKSRDEKYITSEGKIKHFMKPYE